MRGRILIVDDETSMCQLLETDLRLREFVPQWRTSADEALQLAQQSSRELRHDAADLIVVSKAELASNKGLQGPFRIQDVALMKKDRLATSTFRTWGRSRGAAPSRSMTTGKQNMFIWRSSIDVMSAPRWGRGDPSSHAG